MKFFDHQTAATVRNLKNCNIRGLIQRINESLSHKSEWSIGTKVFLDLTWRASGAPYYKVWPAIRKSLFHLSLDIKCENVIPPTCGTVCVRFAKDKRDKFPELQTVAFGFKKYEDGILLIVNGMPECGKFCATCVEMRTGETVENVLAKSAKAAFDEHQESLVAAVRAAILVCILANDPDSDCIKPDVLSSDSEKYQQTKDPKYVDKARRRGVVGWNIGDDYEVCPHDRRGHLHLFHTGKGGATPKILWVRPCVVHRSKLTEVPTGYILPDGTEVEGGKVVS